MRNVKSLIGRGYISLIQDKEELGDVFSNGSDELGLNLGDGRVERQHDNPGVYILKVAFRCPGIVSFRRANARRIDKDDSRLKKGGRIGYFHGGNLLLVARITGFRDVVCQGTWIDFLSQSSGINDGCVWSWPVLDFRDDGGHGEDTCWQDLSAQKRIDEGALASFHLPENRQMKLVGHEFCSRESSFSCKPRLLA